MANLAMSDSFQWWVTNKKNVFFLNVFYGRECKKLNELGYKRKSNYLWKEVLGNFLEKNPSLSSK